DRYHAVGAAALKEIGHELCGDRRAPLILAILPGVAEVRNHGRHTCGAGALQAIDPDEKLHQVSIHRMRCRLDDKAIPSANILLDLHEKLAVGKQLGLSAPKLDVQVFADFLGQLRVGATGEELE